MTRDEALEAFDFFSGRGDLVVSLHGVYHPKVAPAEDWGVQVRPQDGIVLKALTDRADEGGYVLHMGLASQGVFNVLTKAEAHKRQLV